MSLSFLWFSFSLPPPQKEKEIDCIVDDGIPCPPGPPLLNITIRSHSTLKVDIHHIERNIQLKIANTKKTSLRMSHCKGDTLAIRSSPIDHFFFYKNKVKMEVKLCISQVKVVHVLKPVRLGTLDMSQSKVLQLNYDIRVKSAHVVFGRPKTRIVQAE